jgi:hypothetical protein
MVPQPGDVVIETSAQSDLFAVSARPIASLRFRMDG